MKELPGSLIVLPGSTSHFHWAKSSEHGTQVAAIGPLRLEYLDTGDDPRRQNRQISGSVNKLSPSEYCNRQIIASASQ
jgi:hypothetical protein